MTPRTYKKRTADAPVPKNAAAVENPLAGGMPSLTEGASRKELPDAMRQKMENAFGADFSNLHIYESEKVAEGGAKAVTQGNTIAFAPGEFNVYSPHSEALLGHELSHVVSQARGESRGNGLLSDSYLEAKADREGVMAAAGQQVYNGPVTPISASSPMSVAGPMQCKADPPVQSTHEGLRNDRNYQKKLTAAYNLRKKLQDRFLKEHKNDSFAFDSDSKYTELWNSIEYNSILKGITPDDRAALENRLSFSKDTGSGYDTSGTDKLFRENAYKNPKVGDNRDFYKKLK